MLPFLRVIAKRTPSLTLLLNGHDLFLLVRTFELAKFHNKWGVFVQKYIHINIYNIIAKV